MPNKEESFFFLLVKAIRWAFLPRELDAESQFKDKDSATRRKYMRVKDRKWSVGVKIPLKTSFTAKFLKANTEGRARAKMVVSHTVPTLQPFTLDIFPWFHE